MTSTTLYRIESDLLGTVNVPRHALYGAHTQRALENFRLSQRPVHRALVHAYGMVKLACARTNHDLGRWSADVFAAIEQACQEMADGQLDDHVVVDALQGGAGTSTNMNVNEVITNRALQRLDRPLGDYDFIHPIDDINLHQSTNDSYPTALRVAAIGQLRGLERDVTALLESFQRKEHEFSDVVKVGRTQLQDAVLTTLGRSMGAYAEAFARDRWRIYKCEERLRVVNLGGTAIGTGLGAPRQYIFRVVDHLQRITGMGLARSENLIDATQNTDVLVEVSGIIRSLASNLLKVSNDLRLLASGPHAGLGELRLPAKQAGSSIMPGKVNPVIPEAVGQAAVSIIAHDSAIVQACSLGNLELNQFMPLLADSLLSSLTLARQACRIFVEHCVNDLQANRIRCAEQVGGATATITALVDAIGYEAAQNVAVEAEAEGKSIRQVVVEKALMSGQQFDAAISPPSVMQLGSRPTQQER
jgi:aspartate ammonia-lyase